jgi:hypothetical protein
MEKNGIFPMMRLVILLTLIGIIIEPAIAMNEQKSGIQITGNDPILVIDADTGEQAELSYERLQDFRIDTSIPKSSPYWAMLLLGTDQRRMLMDFINDRDIPKEKKEEWKTALNEMWKKYPVKLEKNQQPTLITIDTTSREFSLTADENAILLEIEAELGEAASRDLNGDIGVTWNGNTHKGISYYSCYRELGKQGYSDDDSKKYADICQNYADVPDTWHYGSLILTAYNHGYLLDYKIGIGAAPDNCLVYANQAKDNYRSANLTGAFESLGYSSHFMEDLGNPMHTGNGFDQYAFKNAKLDIHTIYEDYVNENWILGTAYYFEQYAMNENNRYTINSPRDSAIELASVSYSKENELYLLIINSMFYDKKTHEISFDLSTQPRIRDITQERITETTKYANGLVDYVIRDGFYAYTITPSAGDHGSINPNVPQTVQLNNDAIFYITPDVDYGIDKIYVDGIPQGFTSPYIFTKVTSDHSIYVTFRELSLPSGWLWQRDTWSDWQHTWSVSGTQTGPNSEYGPLMVNDHGEHGTNTNLLAGSAESSVWRTFTDTSGNGWNMITFRGAISYSDRPNGRWMQIKVNDQQVFAATELNNPPGSSGQPFEISASFPQTQTATVRISQGQYPAWGPRFSMEFYSVELTNQEIIPAVIKTESVPFVKPDGQLSVVNESVTSKI